MRRTQQLLTKREMFKQRKRGKVPAITSQHAEKRLNCSKDYGARNASDRKHVIFSDAERFNLDSPDGFAHYQHDLRKEPRTFSRRQHGNGSIMVWGVMSYNGPSNLVTVSQMMNPEIYCRLLKKGMLFFAESKFVDP